MSNIFITGATGFLGPELIKEILTFSDDRIYALVRGEDAVKARQRLISKLEEVFNQRQLNDEEKGRIEVYVGDITRKNMGFNKNVLHNLIEKIDTIYHTAAITDLNQPLEKVRDVNAYGTRNVLDFAVLCKKKNNFKKVNHISTVYVMGIGQAQFKENDLEVGQKFNNTYEQTKYEAEQVIFQYRKKGLDIDIFRPSIILGRYKDGKTTKFKMFYQPLHFFSLELFNKIPVIKDGKTHLVNIDIAARAIYLINNLSKAKNINYHIVSPDAPTFSFILNMASEYFGFRKLEFVLAEELDLYEEYSPTRRKMIEPYIPYFNCLTELPIENTLTALRESDFSFPKFDEENFVRLFEYCDKSGFIKRKKCCY